MFPSYNVGISADESEQTSCRATFFAEPALRCDTLTDWCVELSCRRGPSRLTPESNQQSTPSFGERDGRLLPWWGHGGLGQDCDVPDSRACQGCDSDGSGDSCCRLHLAPSASQMCQWVHESASKRKTLAPLKTLEPRVDLNPPRPCPVRITKADRQLRLLRRQAETRGHEQQCHQVKGSRQRVGCPAL